MNQLVGLDEPARSADLHARPVPFSEELWIEGEAVRAGTRWQVVDALGREAMTGPCMRNGSARIDGQALLPGIYTVIIRTDSGVHSIRTLKQ